MRNRYQVQNFYIDQLSNPVTLTPSWTWTTIIPVTTVPSIVSGRFFYVIFKPTDTTNRTILRCYLSSWSVVCNNRDIPLSKTFQQYDTIAIFDVSELYNAMYKQIDDFWYVEFKYNNIVSIYWWFINIQWTDYTIPDSTLTLVNWTREIYFDYVTRTFLDTDTAWLSTAVWIYLAQVVITAWAIVSITDKRWTIVPDRLSSLFFDISSWKTIIKWWSITSTQLDASLWAQLSDTITKTHVHTNKSILDLLSDVGWELKYNWNTIWEINTITNVGNWVWVYKEKIWVDFKLKSIKWVWNIKITDNVDQVEVEQWVPVDMQVETFTWDWFTNTWTLTDTPVWLIIISDNTWASFIKWIDYTLVWDLITFTTTPLLWQKIYAQYQADNGSTPAWAWEANTASNVWTTWTWLYLQKIWVDLQFRKLKQWSNIAFWIETWGELRIDASGSNSTLFERWVPSWLVNSSNKVFTTIADPINNWLFLFNNWLFQSPTTDYSITWNSITFVDAPTTWDLLYYESVVSSPQTIWITYTWAVDGINKTFVLWATPVSNWVYIYLNWLWLTLWVDYTIVWNTITMTSAPITWDILSMKYFY